MARKLYTQGEAVSLAGMILAKFIEIFGLIFYLLAKMFAIVFRGIFSVTGIFLDSYDNIRDIGSHKIHPELRIKYEEAVFLAAKESRAGLNWIDESITPIRRILASNQIAFRERTMKKDEIIEKDCEAIFMAKILNRIVLETTFTNSQFRPFKWLRNKTVYPQIFKGRNNKKDIAGPNDIVREGMLKYMGKMRFLVTKCPDDPVKKTGFLLSYSLLSLRYHKTGRKRYQKSMLKIDDRLNGNTHLQKNNKLSGGKHV